MQPDANQPQRGTQHLQIDPNTGHSPRGSGRQVDGSVPERSSTPRRPLRTHASSLSPTRSGGAGAARSPYKSRRIEKPTQEQMTRWLGTRAQREPRRHCKHGSTGTRQEPRLGKPRRGKCNQGPQRRASRNVGHEAAVLGVRCAASGGCAPTAGTTLEVHRT